MADCPLVVSEPVDVVHALDRSRPVTAGLNHPDVSYTNGVLQALDVVGLNYNADWYAKLKGEKPVFGSETAPSLADRDVYLFEERDGRMTPIQATNHLECAYSPKAFTWAARSSYWGLCDLAGLPKDRFYLYRSQWSDKPVAHLMPDWTHPGCEGKVFPVWCYTNGEEAELFLNGVSQGVRRFAGTDDLHLAWDVAYEPGTLEVRAKMHDGTVVTDRRVTAGPVVRYAVTPDFASDGLHFFRIDAVDVRGNRVLSCEDEVSVSVADGMLLALDNGSPRDHAPFGCARRHLFRGSLVAVVKASSQEVRPSISVVLK